MINNRKLNIEFFWKKYFCMKQLIEQNEFLKKYNIDQVDFKKTKLIWNQLKLIYVDYCREIQKLEASGVYILNNLMKLSKVHSVRYRIKDPEHVIEKIIRKKNEDSEIDINIDNYKTELTDLIGLRALHLFKEEWHQIHEYIITTWDLKRKPIANYRKGDNEEYINLFQENGCEVKQHKFGYRSVHYIIETKPEKEKYFAEIQVRTVFEEAWSEIDHTIRYPYNQDNPLFGQYLLNFNRLAGNADEMGTFILNLKRELQRLEENHQQTIINVEEKLLKNSFNIMRVIERMSIIIKNVIGARWELIQININSYFDDHNSRLELLASLYINKQVSLKFFTQCVSDERKILKSFLSTMENIKVKDANVAASSALNIYFKEVRNCITPFKVQK